MAIHNAIQMRVAIDSLIDRVKSPRFTDKRYYEAINQSIKKILDDRTENIKQPKKYSVQSSERLRNELYSLIVNVAPVAGVAVAFPVDYYYLLELVVTCNGETNVCRALSYNEDGLIERNPFKKARAYKTYFNETSSGWIIKVPTGGVISAIDLSYLKTPNIVSIGQENNKISTGANVLTLGSTYYVYDEAVHNTTTYYEGQTFVAVNTALNSGTVINSANIVNSDMPETLQDEIERLAAAILDGTVQDYVSKQDLKVDNAES